MIVVSTGSFDWHIERAPWRFAVSTKSRFGHTYFDEFGFQFGDYTSFRAEAIHLPSFFGTSFWVIRGNPSKKQRNNMEGFNAVEDSVAVAIFPNSQEALCRSMVEILNMACPKPDKYAREDYGMQELWRANQVRLEQIKSSAPYPFRRETE